MKIEVKMIKARAIDRLQPALRDADWAYGQFLNASPRKKKAALTAYRTAMNRLLQLVTLAKLKPGAMIDVPVVK